MYRLTLLLTLSLFITPFAVCEGFCAESSSNLNSSITDENISVTTRDSQLAATAQDLLTKTKPEAWTALEALLQYREKAKGTTDPSLIPVLRAMARMAIAGGRYEHAVSLLHRSLNIEEEWLRQARGGYTETGMSRLLEYMHEGEELIHSLSAIQPASEEAAKLALTVAYVRKGRSVEELIRSYDIFRSEKSIKDVWERLRQAQRNYTMLVLEDVLGATQKGMDVSAREQEVEKLEQELMTKTAIAQQTAGMLAMNTNLSLALDSLSLGIPMGGIYIEVVQFHRYHFPSQNHVGEPGEREYLALVLHSTGKVRAVPLGPADTIDASVRHLLLNMSRPDSDPLPFAQDVYQKVVAPLIPYFKYDDGIDYIEQSIYWSVDGDLNLVPFAALHDGKTYLLEKFRMRYVSSGRDAALFSYPYQKKYSVTVFASPDFKKSIPNYNKVRPETSKLLDSVKKPLPGTRNEAKQIKGLFPRAEVRVEGFANKKAFLETPAPGILHVATHTLFLDQIPSAQESDDDLDLLSQSPSPGASRINPMALSALILAAPSENPAAGGLITPLEIAGMDLAGTQLVVLSACETGRGEIRAGQGVYGLRRAFLVAGAETVVTSLWKVQDAATEELMTLYYQKLSNSESKSEAMDSAMCEIYRKRSHPYYWAPFVVTGRDDLLEGKDGSPIPPPTLRRGIQVTPARDSLCTPPRKFTPIIIGPH